MAAQREIEAVAQSRESRRRDRAGPDGELVKAVDACVSFVESRQQSRWTGDTLPTREGGLRPRYEIGATPQRSGFARALAVAEAGDGARRGELAARVVRGHRGAVPSARLLKLDQPGAGGGEGLRRADPQAVAGHAALDPGVGCACSDDRARRAIRDRGGFYPVASTDAADTRAAIARAEETYGLADGIVASMAVERGLPAVLESLRKRAGREAGPGAGK